MESSVSRDLIEQAASHPTVLAALQARARLVLTRAQLEAYRAGRTHLGDALRLTSGVRPGAKASGFHRPYVRIEATLTPEQMAEDSRRAKLSRLQVIRRATRA